MWCMESLRDEWWSEQGQALLGSAISKTFWGSLPEKEGVRGTGPLSSESVANIADFWSLREW